MQKTMQAGTRFQVVGYAAMAFMILEEFADLSRCALQFDASCPATATGISIGSIKTAHGVSGDWGRQLGRRLSQKLSQSHEAASSKRILVTGVLIWERTRSAAASKALQFKPTAGLRLHIWSPESGKILWSGDVVCQLRDSTDTSMNRCLPDLIRRASAQILDASRRISSAPNTATSGLL